MAKVIFFYGLPSAGKTTIARKLKEKLGKAVHLDGDEVRSSITKHLGFSKKDRVENMRIVASAAELIRSQGIDVIVSLVAPHMEGRSIFDENCEELLKIYVSTPPEICYERDVKGLYAKAFNNEIENMTGVGNNYDYESDSTHNIILATATQTPDECADFIMDIAFPDRSE